MPETPRFLFKIGRERAAFEVLRDIGGEELARRELEEIRASYQEAFNGFAELNRPGIRRALLVGFVLAVLVQASGINAIIDYAPRILQSAGWRIDAALFSTFGLGIVNVLFTLVSVYTIDRSGRKPLYIIGSIGMTVALLLLTILSGANAFTGAFVFVLMHPLHHVFFVVHRAGFLDAHVGAFSQPDSRPGHVDSCLHTMVL